MNELRSIQSLAVPAGIYFLTVLSLLLASPHTHADLWTLRPSISLKESLTDNLLLSPRETREGELISTLTPGIFIQRQSKRLELAVNYRLQGVFYKINPDENKVINLLDASGTGILLKDRFFVDIASTSGEQNISNRGRLATDNSSITGDRVRVLTYRVSPYWHERVGNFMDAEFRYERNGVDSSRELNNSNSDIYTFSLTSGAAFARLLWDITSRYEKIDHKFENPTRFRNISAEATYLITEKLGFKSVGGYDNNDYASTSQDIEGYSWRLGGIFKPSRRTSFEATIGERYFGRDMDIKVSHRARKTQWLFNYYRRPDTTRSTLLQQQIFPLNDAFGNPVIDPESGEQSMINVNVPGQSAEVFISEKINSVFKYQYKHNTLNLSAFRENRKFQISTRNEEVYGVDLGWIWELNRKMDSRLSIALSTNNTIDSRKQDFIVMDYSLTRLLSPGLSMSISYSYVNISSNIEGGSYTRNLVSTSISKQF